MDHSQKSEYGFRWILALGGVFSILFGAQLTILGMDLFGGKFFILAFALLSQGFYLLVVFARVDDGRLRDEMWSGPSQKYGLLVLATGLVFVWLRPGNFSPVDVFLAYCGITYALRAYPLLVQGRPTDAA
jgi:hypothetical protein